MKLSGWLPIQELRELLHQTAPSQAEMAHRLQIVERDIILPVKAVIIGFLSYYLYHSRWFPDMASYRSIAQQIVEQFFIIYLLLNVVVALVLILGRHLPSVSIQRIIFSASFVDGLFLSALTFVTGGFDSTLYWVFLGLIVRNAVSLPLAFPQILLNFLLSFCYLLAGVLDVFVQQDATDIGEALRAESNPTEPFLLRLIVLWLMTLCCYGVQVLLERHNQAEAEAREFSSRQKQLHSAGRLAARIAHQIKNPLAIINNAAYSLHRSLQSGKSPNTQQVEIIREEVTRADNIITKLMGYARLAEGKVERLQVIEELERAVAEVLPPAMKYDVQVVRAYQAGTMPTLFMQRAHLEEIFVNLLLNAREASQGRGILRLSVTTDAEETITVRIQDSGTGIPPEWQDKIFEPYFSSKPKGTGLGLAIVKQNVEFYGGGIQVHSELGTGTEFVLNLPTRTLMKLPS